MGVKFGSAKAIDLDGHEGLHSKDFYLGKYQKINFDDFIDYFISFDFVDMSMEGGNFCFNNATNIEPIDYDAIFRFLKAASGVTVRELLIDKTRLKEYRIKYMNPNPTKNKEFIDQVKRTIGLQPEQHINLHELPTIYQVRLYDGTEKAPRLYFIPGINGTLSVILLDLYHHFFLTEKR